MLMVDAAFTIISLPSAAVPFNSAAIAGSRGIPRVVAADDDRGAGQGGNLGRPAPLCSREDADGIASLYVDRAAAVDYRCVAWHGYRPGWLGPRLANKPKKMSFELPDHDMFPEASMLAFPFND